MRTLHFFSLLFTCLLIVGCHRAPKPPPLPKPVIVSQKLTQNLLVANELGVQIRNEGSAGLVRINVYTLHDIGQLTRGESGIEKTMRESFTRDVEPPPKHQAKYQRSEQGHLEVQLQAGETRTVKIQLPVYNWANLIVGDHLFVDAIGIPPARTPQAGNGSR